MRNDDRKENYNREKDEVFKNYLSKVKVFIFFKQLLDHFFHEILNASFVF